MQVQTYLFFEGRCQEALDFYREVLGAEVTMLMHYRDNPEPPSGDCTIPPEMADKVMHASLRIGETMLMASDGRCSGVPAFGGFALSVAAADDAEAARLFAALSEGGEVRMPLGRTFFASSFGMLTDRFGVGWMVMAQN